jgi:hypothetical protein
MARRRQKNGECFLSSKRLTMAVRIRRVKMWRTSIRNRPGVLASTLEPLAQAGADLSVVMKYSLSSRSRRATVEILAGSARRTTLAAHAAGFTLSPTPVLLVKGNNRPGLAYAVTTAIAWAGITVRFLSAQVVDQRYSAILGFRTEEDTIKARSLIRKVATTTKV